MATTTASTGRRARLATDRWADGQTVEDACELCPGMFSRNQPIVATVAPGAHLPMAGVFASWSHATTPNPFIC